MADQATQQEVKTKIIELLASPDVGGSISHACKTAGWSRQTILDWRKSDPVFDRDVREALVDGKQELAGMAERALVKRIEAGDTVSIIFTLKSLRRDVYGSQEEIAKEKIEEDKTDGMGIDKIKTLRDAQLLLSLLMGHFKHQISKTTELSEADKGKITETVSRTQKMLQNELVV